MGLPSLQRLPRWYGPASSSLRARRKRRGRLNDDTLKAWKRPRPSGLCLCPVGGVQREGKLTLYRFGGSVPAEIKLTCNTCKFQVCRVKTIAPVLCEQSGRQPVSLCGQGPL